MELLTFTEGRRQTRQLRHAYMVVMRNQDILRSLHVLISSSPKVSFRKVEFKANNMERLLELSSTDILESTVAADVHTNFVILHFYNQMESDEPRDENSMDYSDQKELSDEYYTKKFRKVNKEDRRDDDKLRRQDGDAECFLKLKSIPDIVYQYTWRLLKEAPNWRLDNQSIERDRLIGVGFVLDFVEFISFTFGDKEMILVIEAVSR
ncbi:hypothetical protein Tco_1201976 [Tanacetum coccineum]